MRFESDVSGENSKMVVRDFETTSKKFFQLN